MTDNVTKSSNRYLYLAVFTSGMTTLAVELSASRLLGNVFGTSNIVWANVIGLILLYLTAGYFIGGRWADRSPYFTTFYRILLWGAFLSALIPLVARIVCCCDAYNAMTTDRSYRAAMPVHVALAELRAHAGTQFDPDVVETVCALIERWDPEMVSEPQTEDVDAAIRALLAGSDEE
mgnify:CR=1 FL=1